MVRESAGNVTLVVRLLQGTLGRNVTVTVNTASDGMLCVERDTGSGAGGQGRGDTGCGGGRGK